MTAWPEGPPMDFREACEDCPASWSVSHRVLEPVLEIFRSDGSFSIRLRGRKILRGVEQAFDAPGLEYNWVSDGQTIRPLPHDTPKLVADLLDGRSASELAFTDVVQLLRVDQQLLKLQADPSVFQPARESTAHLADTVAVPGLNATLYGYQAQGVRWMRQTLSHTGGLILADEMGLGKTIQIIALLLCERPSNIEPALIVCPTSLIANWRSEILKFAPELTVFIHRGAYRTGIASGLQQAQIIITTYDTLVNDVSIFEGVKWSWVICDEAQAVKNPDTARRTAIAGLNRRRTIPMTGTPVEASLLDLWSLSDLAIPGLLGSRRDFSDRFPDNEEAAKQLAQLTNPVVLRRSVADVAGDLPERIDVDIPLELGPQLSGLYENVRQDAIEKYAQAGALVATGQLQIFCAHPWLQAISGVELADDTYVEHVPGISLMTPKMERTVSLLDEAFQSGRKVLLFAVFNRCGELVRRAGDALREAYWNAINGSTPQEERQKIVDEFSAHDGPACLVLNPKAAGAGLNITAATVVIHYTQAWNPALEAQASARAHRRGQTEPVWIYRLFYEDTVERVMIDRSEWRRTMGNDAVPDSVREGEDLRRALSMQPGRVDG